MPRTLRSTTQHAAPNRPQMGCQSPHRDGASAPHDARECANKLAAPAMHLFAIAPKHGSGASCQLPKFGYFSPAPPRVLTPISDESLEDVLTEWLDSLDYGPEPPQTADAQTSSPPPSLRPRPSLAAICAFWMGRRRVDTPLACKPFCMPPVGSCVPFLRPEPTAATSVPCVPCDRDGAKSLDGPSVSAWDTNLFEQLLWAQHRP